MSHHPLLPNPLPLHHGFFCESLAASGLFARLLFVGLADVPSDSNPLPIIQQFVMGKVRVGFAPFRKLQP